MWTRSIARDDACQSLVDCVVAPHPYSVRVLGSEGWSRRGQERLFFVTTLYLLRIPLCYSPCVLIHTKVLKTLPFCARDEPRQVSWVAKEKKFFFLGNILWLPIAVPPRTFNSGSHTWPFLSCALKSSSFFLEWKFTRASIYMKPTDILQISQAKSQFIILKVLFVSWFNEILGRKRLGQNSPENKRIPLTQFVTLCTLFTRTAVLDRKTLGYSDTSSSGILLGSAHRHRILAVSREKGHWSRCVTPPCAYQVSLSCIQFSPFSSTKLFKKLHVVWDELSTSGSME